MDRLRYNKAWLAYVEAGIGSPAIMLVHDSAADHRSLLPLFSLLSARHRTVALDLPGHGESTVDQANRTDRTDTSDPSDIPQATPRDQAIALHWLRRQLGLGRVVLVGEGNGSLVTIAAADLEHTRIHALVRIGLTDPMWPPPRQTDIPCLDLSVTPATGAGTLATGRNPGDIELARHTVHAIERFLDGVGAHRTEGGPR